ncbi:hypothetical protein OPT61_g3891 [Boeremia exigua]|uniref:Uncharacterized protein n=1 Tax=Boeremia exigua TaxID=749465 RepID=A0ACC2IGA3_9PLEO|nr:hypothetical protein OPT61_g3891 [Boeremia exigua]
MSDSLQHSNAATGCNLALARDLENLPLELIEQVIGEATFEQMVRLSSWAGPRLKHAFEISPSWRYLFGSEEDRTSWQRCLLTTDNLNAVYHNCRNVLGPYRSYSRIYNRRCWHSDCVRPGCSKDVSFLPWNVSPKDQGAYMLRSLWLEKLNAQLCEASPFDSLPFLKDIHAYVPAEGQTLFKQLGNPEQRKFSEVELETVTHLFQQALTARKTALVSELRRLAALYETHPTLLKSAFAPQSSRPSAHHLPEQFRQRARKLATPPSLYSRLCCRTYFQDEFTALVPYDWTLRFFVAATGKEQDLLENYQFVLDGITSYYLRDVEHSSKRHSMRTTGTPYSLPSRRKEDTQFLAGKSGPTRGRGGPYSAHSEIELVWLETFVELVASLVEKYPEAAWAAQAEDLVKEAKVDDLADSLATNMRWDDDDFGSGLPVLFGVE